MEDALPPDDQHAAIELLLPWYANGGLDPAERAMVEAHLPACAACRADVAAEPQIAVALATRVPEPDTGWTKMAARLDTSIAPAVPVRRRSRGAQRGRAPRRSDPIRWLAAAQFAVIAMLAAWMFVPSLSSPRADGGYRALGDGTRTAGNVLIMFRPDTPEAQLRHALAASGARLVDGPTSAGAYVLAIPGSSYAAALTALRRDSAVTLAEPIGRPPAP